LEELRANNVDFLGNLLMRSRQVDAAMDAFKREAVLFENDKPSDWQVFFQPGGLEPDAENLPYLMQTPVTLQLAPTDPIRIAQGRTYYDGLSRARNAEWVTRYVLAKYGPDPSGAAVFRGSFKKAFHVKKGLIPVLGMPILVGQDFGRNPCSLIAQPDHSGRLSVLEEVVSEDMGLEMHITRFLRPKIYQERFAGLRFAAVGDPSGTSKGNFLEEDHFDVMGRLGIPGFPAPTNNIDPRILAVETLLLQQRDGGPALVIDEDKCPMLVQALQSRYRYSKTQAGAVKPLPDKSHPWSDLADCLQYICLIVNSGMVNYISKKIRPRVKTVPKTRVSAAGWT